MAPRLKKSTDKKLEAVKSVAAKTMEDSTKTMQSCKASGGIKEPVKRKATGCDRPRATGGYKNINPQVGRATQFKSGEQQAKIARKGAMAAAENKRRKKTNKQLLLDLISCKPTMPQATLESLKKLGITGQLIGADADQYTIELIATAAMIQKAMKGDLRAYEMMLAVIGEKPVDTVIVQTDSATAREVEQQLFGGE